MTEGAKEYREHLLEHAEKMEKWLDAKLKGVDPGPRPENPGEYEGEYWKKCKQKKRTFYIKWYLTLGFSTLQLKHTMLIARDTIVRTTICCE